MIQDVFTMYLQWKKLWNHVSGKIKKEKDEYTCTKNLNYRPIQINNSDVYACLEPDNQLKCSSVNKMFHRNYFVDIFTISSES